MLWSLYPFTDFHELNLDWLLKTVKILTERFKSIEDQLTQLDEIEAYVQNYLNSLDWDALAADAIQELYDNGDLADLIANYIQAMVTPTLDQLTEDLAALTGRVDALHNTEGAYYRDSSTTEAHDLDFYYISSSYTGDESDGTKDKPFKTLDEAIANTINKGILCPNFRFLSGGTYVCSTSVFNAVTWHMSAYTSPIRPKIVFTNFNNVTFYNSHINWAGIDVSVPEGYLFRGENSEIHLGDDVTLDRRLMLASCGAHLSNFTGESISASNSKVYLEGTCELNPAVQNAFVISYNSDVTIDGSFTINDSTFDGDSRAFYVFDNSSLYLKTAPTVGSGHTVDLRVNNSRYLSTPEIYSEFTRTSLSGINTIQTATQVIS